MKLLKKGETIDGDCYKAWSLNKGYRVTLDCGEILSMPHFDALLDWIESNDKDKCGERQSYA